MTSVCLLYSSLKTFYSLFQIDFLCAGFFKSEKDFFSWHSRNCYLQGEAVKSSWLFCLIYGSGTFWRLMRNGSDVCWTFPPLALWKETSVVPDLEISLAVPSVRLSWDLFNPWHANSWSWNVCLLQRNGRVFISEFTKVKTFSPKNAPFIKHIKC
jgi:hypothetical protein